MSILRLLIAMGTTFALLWSASGLIDTTEAANESATIESAFRPRSTFSLSSRTETDWKFEASIAAPAASPKVAPLKRVVIDLPDDIEVRPNSVVTPVCPDSKVGPATGIGRSLDSIILRCPDSVVGNGVAGFYLAGINSPGGPQVNDLEMVVFNGGKGSDGEPQIKIYGSSRGSGVNVYMEGSIADGQIVIQIPVLPLQSAIGEFSLDLPGQDSDFADRRGRDPGVIQARCSTGFLATGADFVLGTRDPSGTPTSPDTLIYAPDSLSTCTGDPDLSVSKSGSGAGSVTSETEGIVCGNRCRATFPLGDEVTLKAVPDADSVFTGWSGDCSGTGRCVLRMDAEKAARAKFDVKLSSAPVRKASISKVSVSGPARVQRGRDAIYRVRIENSGGAAALGVELRVKGDGFNLTKYVGIVSAGKARIVKLKLKAKRSGSLKAAFRVWSSNAGGQTVRWPTQRSKGREDPLSCSTIGSIPATMDFLDHHRIKSICGTELAVVQARPTKMSDGDVTGNWRLVSEAMGGHADVMLPGPGRWQVRLFIPGTSKSSKVRSVFVEEPVCEDRKVFGTDESGLVTECTLNAQKWPARQRGGKYVVQWLGDRPLDTVSADRVAVYFHGDGGCCFDGWERGVGAFAIQRNMLIVNAIAPTSYPGGQSPAWGATFADTNSADTGYQVGYELRQIAASAGTDRFLYWSASGGSWFLSSNYIPTGLRFAPGPLALNCGGSRPSRSFVRAVPHSVRIDSPIRFSFGSKDFLAGDLKSAFAVYKASGWPVTSQVWPGLGHCEPDFDASNIAWFTSVL